MEVEDKNINIKKKTINQISSPFDTNMQISTSIVSNLKNWYRIIQKTLLAH